MDWESKTPQTLLPFAKYGNTPIDNFDLSFNPATCPNRAHVLLDCHMWLTLYMDQNIVFNRTYVGSPVTRSSSRWFGFCHVCFKFEMLVLLACWLCRIYSFPFLIFFISNFKHRFLTMIPFLSALFQRGCMHSGFQRMKSLSSIPLL